MTTPRLTYADGLLRQAQALAQAGALEAVLVLYAQAAHRDPTRFAAAPGAAQVEQAIAMVRLALRTLTTEDFREVGG